jgi:hypothetical protein
MTTLGEDEEGIFGRGWCWLFIVGKVFCTAYDSSSISMKKALFFPTPT